MKEDFTMSVVKLWHRLLPREVVESLWSFKVRLDRAGLGQPWGAHGIFPITGTTPMYIYIH